MTHRLAIALLVLPLAASAAPPQAQPQGQGDTSRFERFEKRMKLARTLGLAEALDLNDAEALKMRDVMARFDDRRKPILKQVRDDARLVRRAAEGDKDAVGQSDQAVQRIFDSREKLHAIDREMYQALAKDLTPARRARLAVFFAKFHQRMGRMMMERRAGAMGFGGQGCMGQGCPAHEHGPGMMRGPGMRGPGGKGPGGGPSLGMNGPGPEDDDLFGDQ